MLASGVRGARFVRRNLIMAVRQRPGARNREGACAPPPDAGALRAGDEPGSADAGGHCGAGGSGNAAAAGAAMRYREGAWWPVAAAGVGGGTDTGV